MRRFQMTKTERMIFQSLFYFKRDKLRQRTDVSIRKEEFCNGIAFALTLLIERDLSNLGLEVRIKSNLKPNTLKIRVSNGTHTERKTLKTEDLIYAEDPRMLFEETLTKVCERVLEADNDSN